MALGAGRGKGVRPFMSWAARLRRAPERMGSALAVVLLAGLIGAAGLWGLNTIQDNMVWLARNSAPSLVWLLRTQNDVNAAIRNERGALIAPDNAAARRFAVQATDARTDAWRQYQLYQALPYT